MMPVIRIPDSVYERLQQHATPFVDTPATVIERLLDAFERAQPQYRPNPNPQTIEGDLVLAPVGNMLSSANRTSDLWTGFWFVNVGENEWPWRNWDDCVRYGFLSAGKGRIYSDPLRKLSLGSKVFAYMSGFGYVGYGEVTQEVCPVKEFTPESHNEPLLELPLSAPKMDHDRDDLDLCEWVVRVKWHRTFPRDEAKKFAGIFANPNVVCRLRDQRTIDFLRREFNVQPAGA